MIGLHKNERRKVMKKVRRGKLFAIVMLLLTIAGSLLNFEMVQATETDNTTASSEESQSGKVTKSSNVTKKVTKKNADVSKSGSLLVGIFYVLI